MIHVHEKWTIKNEFVGQALEIMQKLDYQLGELAHDHSGWMDHAHFYQDGADPTQIIMSYDWRTVELHDDMCVLESAVVTSIGKIKRHFS
jgi:hypothetical protein